MKNKESEWSINWDLLLSLRLWSILIFVTVIIGALANEELFNDRYGPAIINTKTGTASDHTFVCRMGLLFNYKYENVIGADSKPVECWVTRELIGGPIISWSNDDN